MLARLFPIETFGFGECCGISVHSKGDCIEDLVRTIQFDWIAPLLGKRTYVNSVVPQIAPNYSRLYSKIYSRLVYLQLIIYQLLTIRPEGFEPPTYGSEVQRGRSKGIFGSIQ